ncbi:hypothetical protein Dtox_1395 [Desulfofarcimen acetoxidans DSM 771]|uniref:Uncharacterized protein n=1 Tax=Desulfofarcimen acetoxidans (strain ATCC 49208 / DSM 771 / KCTC 5769 / VKM B-1644 / 5575) TaxID=485916 RepID=C8W6I2_DESAS|nr:hypothetical protein [Desulfofarcimen acetoxidans]ACV62271.1 hypothetical protein Dtox_1395 [Desulfofarcimen acetoxidans DSM 771]
MINILSRIIKRELNEIEEKINHGVEQEQEKAVYTGQILAYQKVLHYIEDITGKSLSNTGTLNFGSEQKKDGLSLDEILKSLGDGFKKIKEKPSQD